MSSYKLSNQILGNLNMAISNDKSISKEMVLIILEDIKISDKKILKGTCNLNKNRLKYWSMRLACVLRMRGRRNSPSSTTA